MQTNFSLEGAKKLEKQLKRLGKSPQRSVQLAARKGATFAQRDAKSNAPVDIGHLKSGIKIYGERTTKTGKKVYMVVFARAMNHIFQKYNAEARAKLLTGQKVAHTAYYPASQEFGWRMTNGRKVPGKFFMRDAVEDNRPQINKIIEDTLLTQLEKSIKKLNL